MISEQFFLILEINIKFSTLLFEYDDQTYYHDGSGTYPVANDTVYTNSGGTTTIANGTYRLDNNTRFVVFGGSGVVSLVESCSP